MIRSSDHADTPWFFVVVEGNVDGESLIGQQCYYVRRARLGEAIDCALADAADLPSRLEDVAPVYVSVVVEAEFDGDLCETDIDGLITSDELYVRPKSEGRSFICPTGIVPSGWQPDGVDRSALTEGFAAKSKPGRFTLEAQLEHGDIRELSASLISVLPTVDCLVVMLLDHYDKCDFVDEPTLQRNDVQCLSKELGVSPSEIIQQLENLETNVLDNGYVDFGVSSYDVECTIWLTEHKTIHVVNSTAHVHEEMRDMLAAKLTEVAHLESFSNCYSHFHFRPPQSLAADELTRWLLSEGWDLDDSSG